MRLEIGILEVSFFPFSLEISLFIKPSPPSEEEFRPLTLF